MSDIISIRRYRWILGTALAATGLFMLRYGYGFGFSDQDEFLPLVSRILDKDLFLADWFVSMQFEGFSIRWPMALLVALPSTFLPVWAVVFLVHLSTAIVSATAVARLSDRIFQSRMTTLVIVVTVMAVTTRFNPGGNDILHGMLVPSSVAWCLILTAVERMQARRFLTSGFLLGGAALFHPLIGLQAGSVLLLIALTWGDVSTRQRIRLSVPFLAVLTPLLIQLAAVGKATPEATTILTTLRAPHHYLPGAFTGSSWILFISLVAFATACLLLDTSSRQRTKRYHRPTYLPPISTRDRQFLARMIIVPTVLLGCSLLVTAWPLQWPQALRLQPWAVSPLVRVLATIVLCGYVMQWLMARSAVLLPVLDGPKSWLFPYRSRVADTGLLVAGAMLLLFSLYAQRDAIHGTAHPDQKLHAWAQKNSTKDAVFVVPPSMTGFQFGSKRAQYVSFKSFPFADAPTLAWWQRLQDIAPVSQHTPGGMRLLQRLDSAYAHRSLADIRTFVATNSVDFIVRPQPDPAGWKETESTEWCDDRWCVFWAGRILTQPARPASQ